MESRNIFLKNVSGCLTPLSQALSYIYMKKCLFVCLSVERHTHGAGNIACHHRDPCNGMAVLRVQTRQMLQMVTDSDLHKTCFKHMNQQVHNVQFKTMQL